MKHFFSTILLFVSGLLAQAQLLSPEQFLGYPIGTRYTPHHKIVAYLQHAAQHSKMVSLQQYGSTYEHRPLMVAFVGSENNIAQLEKIRTNNLLLARQGVGSNASANAPAIVWLSYNVHGSEPASSEAAMLTLYALINPAHAQSKAWLQNTLVVIDACQNPDGRDRYVNWYNSVVGTQYHSAALAREHREPWPGGRTNHYNFDLNRDWAWQTQLESRHRIALYNKWLPQVHVDVHEQSYNAPYYFAPAAEPIHEVVTPWQREFQNLIGKNNARYFDENNWLYFTRERFDLLYPSYGDTYPMYNGAIGMTYEQGGIGGGLGVVTAEGDTLTLVQRALHHYTSSLSTIETTAAQSSKLITEFKNYFDQAVSGKLAHYKTYIVRHQPGDEQRIAALKLLLQKNAIAYGTASGSGSGYNYFSQKEERFTIAQQDLVISALQPKAAMVQALFEPHTRLSDSATYDITAWAMPYCYGLNAYASTQAFTVQAEKPTAFVPNSALATYGYIIPVAGGARSALVAQLLQQGIRLRIAEKPFTLNGQSYAAGAAIILKTGNEKWGNNLWSKVMSLANQYAVTLYPATSGMVEAGADFGSDVMGAIKAPSIVLLSGDAVTSYSMGEVWSFFDEELQYPIQLVNTGDAANINWARTDVLIMADGNYALLNDKAWVEKLTAWIRGGGRLIALERAVKQLSRQEWAALKLKPATDDTAKESAEALLTKYADRERNEISGTTPGAIFKVWVDNTHPMFFGYPSHYYTLKMDDALYSAIKPGQGWNTGVLKTDKPMSGFVGHQLAGQMNNAVLFAVQDMGRGHVVYLADDVLFRRFWENGKQVFFNSVFLIGR